MNTDEIRSKLHETLKEAGVEGDQIDVFLYLLQPLITEYLQMLIEKNISEAQANELALQGLEEGLDEKEIAVAMQYLYEEKTGKTLQDEINTLVSMLADNIKAMQTEMKQRLDEIMSLPADQRLEEFQKDILKDLEPSQNE
ncbi:hypothetical protein KC678_00150 [Candidatus Dojkabacteria bacterium]|uniref:Uncharacterized protein n=1 Tax=Candidatus Dojkabacteria bacterium TaxID=2099670 RepID=A0A955L1I1_9BACT|nr:hypothetical protein [Candidatus Dojkabacteria bacterium]